MNGYERGNFESTESSRVKVWERLSKQNCMKRVISSSTVYSNITSACERQEKKKLSLVTETAMKTIKFPNKLTEGFGNTLEYVLSLNKGY